MLSAVAGLFVAVLPEKPVRAAVPADSPADLESVPDSGRFSDAGGGGRRINSEGGAW